MLSNSSVTSGLVDHQNALGTLSQHKWCHSPGQRGKGAAQRPGVSGRCFSRGRAQPHIPRQSIADGKSVKSPAGNSRAGSRVTERLLVSVQRGQKTERAHLHPPGIQLQSQLCPLPRNEERAIGRRGQNGVGFEV